jgi:hypothetical protein
MDTLKAGGVIQDGTPRVLNVLIDGQPWYVSVPDNPRDLVFEGMATSRWLQRGMPVRFECTVVMEKRMREIVIKEPVTELTVAPVPPNVTMGIHPEQQHDQRSSLFSRRSGDADKRAPQGPVELPCLVIGQLVENRDGRLRVAAGRASVRAELDPKAEISVQWHDVRWARKGDKIELSARYPAGRKGQAQGLTMTIKAAQTLDVVGKTPQGSRDDRQAPPKEDRKAETKGAPKKETKSPANNGG